MRTQFAPVDLKSIQQGDFLREGGAAFRKLQHEFIAHVEQFGRAAGAVLTLKVRLSFDAEKAAYAIITEIEAKMPKHPPGVTSAFVAEDPEGGVCLFSQAAGTSDGDPRQGRLCDDGGVPIDLSTGRPAGRE